MLDSAGHRVQAERVESLLKIVSTHAPQYPEWIIVLWFYAALHYVEAFLALQRGPRSRRHEDRAMSMSGFPETRAIQQDYHRLYKLSREARYDGTPFTGRDLQRIEPLYQKIRDSMRTALGLSV